MLHLRPEYSRQEWHHGRCPDGRSAYDGPTITVDVADEGPYVVLRLDPHHAETIDDHDIDRRLLASEARSLAAALLHFAAEAERPR